MKNYFYFILKVFVLRIFNFLPDFFRQVGKCFDKKAMIDFKIYDVTTWETITTHVLHNISRSKGNQTMKFGQVIEYYVRNTFLQKTCRK